MAKNTVQKHCTKIQKNLEKTALLFLFLVVFPGYLRTKRLKIEDVPVITPKYFALTNYRVQNLPLLTNENLLPDNYDKFPWSKETILLAPAINHRIL